MFLGGMDLRLRPYAAPADGPFNNHPTLTNGLVSYWALDEESGVRADSVGSNDLSDNNTVGFIAGKNGNAASFIATNSERLTKASPTGLPVATSDLTIALWVDKPGAGFTVASALLNSGQFAVAHNWEIRAVGANALGFDVWDATPARIASSTSGAIGADFSLIVATVDFAAKTVNIYVNNVAGTPASWTTQTPDSSARPFAIGGYGGGGGSYFDGGVDAVGVWSRLLTAQERADLWNSGNGLFYGS